MTTPQSRNLVWATALIIVGLAAFGLGYNFSEKTTTPVISKKSQHIIDANNFYRYEVTRDIASALKNNDVKAAKCLADLEASVGFDDIKACTSQGDCQPNVLKLIETRGLEAFEDRPLSFDYISDVNGKKSCNTN